MVEERRWPLGNKVNEIYRSYYGQITTIKWRDNYIAWAYDKVSPCVIVYVKCIVVSEWEVLSSLCPARYGRIGYLWRKREQEVLKRKTGSILGGGRIGSNAVEREGREREREKERRCIRP